MAARLGMTAGQLLACSSAREITEWAAYFALVSEEEAEANKPNSRRGDPNLLLGGL